MSQFKVGDVVQRVKLPHYVGVVVKLPEMWGDDKKQSYIVAPIGKKRNDTFFAEDLKPYPYKTIPASGIPVRTTGDLVTFSLPDSYGHNYDDTFYVGPREDMRVVDDVWLYPYINWEDRQTYYGSSHWSEVKKVVKPKLKIGDFVRLAGKASSPVVKIIYDRPYKTHVYTLENELFISETRLAEFVFDEKDKSWSHKDVKPVAKAIEKAASTDDIKVGDVVQDRRVDNGDGIGVVLKAEYPRYTVNWVVIDNATADWAEKLVYRDNLKSYFHKSVRNTSDGRKANCVLGVNTTKGKEFYQIAALEVKVIDGTWYYPYVNLQTSELRYGSYYWKDPDEKLYPKFSIGDKLFITDDLGVEQITAVFFDVPTKKFSYCINESWGYIFEEYLDTFKKQGDTWYHPSVLEQKEKIAADCETADLMCNLINIDAGSDNKPTALVTNPELAKKLSDCKDSMGNVFVFGKEEYVGDFFKYTTHKIGPGIGDPKVVAELDLSEPSPNEPSDAFLNVYAQIKKDFVENPDKYGPPIVLDPKAYREHVSKTPACIEEKDFIYGASYLRDCEKGLLAYDKEEDKLAPTTFYAGVFGKSVADAYHNAISLQQLAQLKNAHQIVLNDYGMPIKDILASNSVKDTEPKGVKMNLSPVNARVIRLQSVQLLNSLSKELFTKSFSESAVANEPNKFKILGNIVDHKVPPALALSLAGFSCKYGLAKAPASVKPVLEVLQKEFTDESQAMLTHAKWQVVKLVATDIISSFVSLVQEHLENDI